MANLEHEGHVPSAVINRKLNILLVLAVIIVGLLVADMFQLLLL